MADTALFLKAVMIGLSIAAPVGPIGLLCIERTVSRGPVAGFVAGLGAAAADGVYGALAGFGITAVTGRLVEWQTAIRVGGGLLLLLVAWRVFRARDAAQAATATSGRTLLAEFATVFLLTLANPATILSFVAIFAALGAGLGTGEGPLVVVGGVTLGSAAWWLLLAAIVGRLRDRLPVAATRWIRIGSAAMLAAFALWSLGAAAW